MISEHVSDDDLQRYALVPSECPREVAGHLLSCSFCQNAAAVYLQMTGDLKALPVPAPEFDVYALAMSSIGTAPARPQKEYLSTVIAAAAAVMAVIFLFIFRGYFLAIFLQIPRSILPFALLACLTIPAIRAIELYGSHLKMIDALLATPDNSGTDHASDKK